MEVLMSLVIYVEILHLFPIYPPTPSFGYIRAAHSEQSRCHERVCCSKD